MRFNHKIFFENIRPHFARLGHRLTTANVDAIEWLLNSFERSAQWSDVRHIGYALGTIAHETAWTFEPIIERGARAYFNKYEPNTKIGKRLGNTEPGDGYKYRGRGDVQITGRSNYEKAGRALNLPLLTSPDLATDRDVAFRIMTWGMFGGHFTGKKLTDYINDRGARLVNARRVINGTDKADLIAGYARFFTAALIASKIVSGTPVETEAVAPEPVAPAEPVVIENNQWFDKLPSLDSASTTLGKVEDVATKAGNVSNSSIIVTLLTKVGGWGLMILAVVQDNWIEILVAGAIIGLAVWYWSKSKDRANERLISQS